VIDWSTPYSGGTVILTYTIEIRKSDLTTFAEDLLDCDGTDADILIAASCTVQFATLRAEPYLLPWGASVYARIIATNDIGDSLVSNIGNGAIILTLPDAPYDLESDVSYGQKANQMVVRMSSTTQ
jgi:hypothetical protein